MTSGPEATILDYVNHLNDDAFFERLLESSSSGEIARTVVGLGASDDRTVVSYATMFAEDGCRHLRHVRFRRRLVEGGFLDALRANLTRRNYFVRRDAVVVIGRSFCEARPDAADLFQHCLKHDPLLLDSLLKYFLGHLEDKGESRWSTEISGAPY